MRPGWIARVAAAGFAVLALGCAASAAAGSTLPSGFEERTVASGLSGPTAVAWAPDGTAFIAEQRGRVRVITPGGSVRTSPLIDISSHGEYEVSMEKYNKLKIGMGRSEVESILGGKGTEISSSTGGGMSFSVNKWEGDNFQSIILSFKDEKIMSKSQVGLK